MKLNKLLYFSFSLGTKSMFAQNRKTGTLSSLKTSLCTHFQTSSLLLVCKQYIILSKLLA